MDLNSFKDYISKLDTQVLHEMSEVLNNEIEIRNNDRDIFKNMIVENLSKHIRRFSISITKYQRVEEKGESDYLYVNFNLNCDFGLLTFDFYIQNRRGGIKNELENLKIDTFSGPEHKTYRIHDNYISPSTLRREIHVNELTYLIIEEILTVCRGVIY